MQLLGILVEITSVTREKKGLSEDDFYARLDGESIEAATDAFIQAVVLFLPAHKRTAMETVLEAVEMGIKKTEETLKASKATLVEKVSEAMDKEAKKAMEDLQS